MTLRRKWDGKSEFLVGSIVGRVAESAGCVTKERDE